MKIDVTINAGQTLEYFEPGDFFRLLDASAPVDMLPGSWSPDGREIAFFSDGRLKRIGAEGGRSDRGEDFPAGMVRDDNGRLQPFALRGDRLGRLRHAGCLLCGNTGNDPTANSSFCSPISSASCPSMMSGWWWPSW